MNTVKTTGRTAAVLTGLGRNLLLALYAIFALFPLAWMIILSIKPDNQMFTTVFIFRPTLENFAEVFLHSDYPRFFLNNLVVSSCAVLLSLLVGVPTAYALARYEFKGRESIAFTFLSFRFAPELLVILPIFLIYQKLGLYDTYLGLIWVYQLITLPLLIWILRGFFEDISPEIEHAAQLDGYPWWQVFYKVLLPLVRPGLLSASLLTFIFAWNSFTFPLLLSASKTQTSTVAILKFIASDSVHYGQVAAAAAVSAVPAIVLTLFIQKHLVRGLSLGAVKE